MAIYNQEHRDYGVYRKYPFTDASTLSVSGGSALPAGLLVDAVLYLSTSPDDAEVWLDILDLGDRRVSIRTSKGVTASGTIDGDEVALQDDATGLAAGVLLLGADALVEAKRTRYVMTPRAALFSPSCVFMSTTPGVATINQAAGHLTLEGRDGIRVFTGIVDGRPVLRVDAVGAPKTYEDCETGPAVRCIRFIQEEGALVSAATETAGQVQFNGIGSFTGEALCLIGRTPAAADVLGKLTGEFSPEAWLGSQSIKDAMRAAGYFWLIAPLTLPNLGSSQASDGLVLTWTTGAPLRLPPYGAVAGRGDYSLYGVESNVFGWFFGVPLSIRPFTIIDGGDTYAPASYVIVGSGKPRALSNSMFPVGGASTYFVGDEAAKRVYPISPDAPVDGEIPGTGLAVIVNPDTATYLPFAALMRVIEAPWQPAEPQVVEVCTHNGRIDIYAPHHEEGSNPLKSDRTAATLRLRGRG